MATRLDSPPQSPLHAVGGLLGAAAGWGLSQYVGANLWLPAAAALLLGLLFAKTKLGPEHFAGAIAVTTGHILWMLAGAAFTGQWMPVVIDIVALSAAIVLLWVRPSLTAAGVLGVLQLVALGHNVYVLVDAGVGSPLHRALTMHVIMRLLALGLLIAGLRRMRKRPVAADPADPATAPA